MDHVDDSEDNSHRVRCLRWKELSHERMKSDSDQKAAEVGDQVLRVSNMQKYYTLHDRSLNALISGSSVKLIKANEKLDFEAHESETLAIVGESGCGKSTVAKVLLGLETATGGEIVLNGEQIQDVSVHDRKAEQLAAMQMVFQNPSDTLNPSHTVGQQIGRAIKKFGVETNKKKVRSMVTVSSGHSETSPRLLLSAPATTFWRTEAENRNCPCIRWQTVDDYCR